MKILIRSIFLLLFLTSATAYASPTLVDTQWLKSHINDPDIVLIDMSDETQYQRFHIQNAIQLPYHVLNRRLKNRVSLSIGSKNIIKLLGLLGVTSSSHVVIYDDIGGLHAGRLFWELERIGHKKVSIVDGGLVKWILEGNPVTAKPFHPMRKTIYQQTAQAQKNARNTLAEITDVLPDSRDKKTLLIDVRSVEEYKGNVKARRSGHIPGAKLWSWDNAINFEDQFKFKAKDILQNELSKIGLTQKDQPVVLYCRSAHRAAQSYLTLRSLGFKNVKVYDGSMKQYGISANAPLTKGLKP